MATYSCTYIDVGKGLEFDGSSTWVLYGADFNPTDQSIYSADHCTVYDATTSFNLSGFQPGHEVGACAWEIRRDGPGGSVSQPYWMDFERYNGSWSLARDLRYQFNWDEIISEQYSWGWGRCYFGIDKDEVWAGYSKYRVHIYSIDGAWSYYSPEFTISSLSIDSTLHRAGALWVEGMNLCYTDNTGDEIGQNGKGYKHKIAYDSGYYESVGDSHAGYIRLSDVNAQSIYYVDQFGIKRRTYPSDIRYGGNVNVGSSKKGYMWVGVDSPEYGYGYLCFINYNGGKRRILNGPPAGYS